MVEAVPGVNFLGVELRREFVELALAQHPPAGRHHYLTCNVNSQLEELVSCYPG